MENAKQNIPYKMTSLGTGNNDFEITLPTRLIIEEIQFEGVSLLGDVTLTAYDGTVAAGTAISNAIYLRAVQSGWKLNAKLSGATLGVRLAGRTSGSTTMQLNILGHYE